MATLNIKNLPEPLYRKLRKRAKERRRSVAQEVTRILEQTLAGSGSKRRHSILELQGLGKEIWAGIDAAEHIRQERDSWD